MNHAAFLADIVDNPDDDTPRLIYADWLEDNGDLPRAEFIRVQIERTRLDRDDDRQAELEATERRLLLKYADRWVPAELPLSWTEFRRGFPEVLAPMPSWLTDEQMDSLGPLPIRELRLKGGTGELDTGRIREMEFLARIESLRLESIAGVEVRDVLSSGFLSRLKCLEIEGDGLQSRDLNRILDLPAVGRVESLHLKWNQFNNNNVAKLLSLAWPNLRRLGGDFSRVAPVGLEALLGSVLWSRLQHIDLTGLPPMSLAALVEAIEGMQAVSLDVCVAAHLGGGGVVPALCRAVRWGRLKRLSLLYAQSTAEDFRRLLEHPALGELRELGIFPTPDDLVPGRLLAECPHLTNLTRLELETNCPILGHIARSRYMKRLTRIFGWGSEEDVIAFVRSENAAHVRFLFATDMTDRIAEALAGSPQMSRLTSLLGPGTLTDSAAGKLANSPHLKNLTYLGLNTDLLSDYGQRALLEAEHLGWVGIREEQVKNSRLRKMWKERYGDSERVSLISDGWTDPLE